MNAKRTREARKHHLEAREKERRIERGLISLILIWAVFPICGATIMGSSSFSKFLVIGFWFVPLALGFVAAFIAGVYFVYNAIIILYRDWQNSQLFDEGSEDE